MEQPDSKLLGMKKFLRLVSTLDKDDAVSYFKASEILPSEDLSMEDAKYLLDNSAKLSRILHVLILAQINSLSLQRHEQDILIMFVNKLKKISNVQGINRVADQLVIDSIAARF